MQQYIGMRQLLTLLLALMCMSSRGSCRMTDQMRQEALDTHNNLRKNVYPEAAGMTRLAWSDELEALAEKAAKTCVFEHSTGQEFAGRGENMYLGGKDNFTEILTMMYLEREVYDYENAKCLAGTSEYNGPYGFFNTCGHYLQIVRSDMTSVGCSINRCPSPNGGHNNLAVCEYESMYRDPPYRARKPGEDACELCGYDGYATACDDGMCTMFDAERAVRSKVQRKCLNCGKMQYYGAFDYCLCDNNFYGDVCEKRIQRIPPRSFTKSCNKCQQEGIQCLNGGRAVGSDDSCECVCRRGFIGQYCEIDTEEEANTLNVYLGGGKRFNSYYPVDKSTWKSVAREVDRELSTALSNYCTKGQPRVRISKNYPATTINGSLKIGLHAKCNRGYIAKADLVTAFVSSEKTIGEILHRQGVAVVAID